MKRKITLLAFWACAGISSAQTPHALTVCEVLSAPLRYNGRLITIRARVDGTDEGAWLVGNGCPNVLVTAEHVWPSEIFLAMPTLPAPLRIHQVNFKFDWDSQRKMEAKSEELKKSIPPECLAFTYTGLFETREDWSRAKLNYANGTSKYAGFGHLGEAPAQLLLRSADDVEAVPDCKTNKSEVKK